MIIKKISSTDRLSAAAGTKDLASDVKSMLPVKTLGVGEKLKLPRSRFHGQI